MPRTTNNLTACPECDLLQRAPSLPPGGLAECARCGARLFCERPSSLDHTLAYAIAAAVLFVLANPLVLMGLDGRGRRTDAHLWRPAGRRHHHGMTGVGTVVPLTGDAVPPRQRQALVCSLVAVWPG